MSVPAEFFGVVCKPSASSRHRCETKVVRPPFATAIVAVLLAFGFEAMPVDATLLRNSAIFLSESPVIFDDQDVQILHARVYDRWWKDYGVQHHGLRRAKAKEGKKKVGGKGDGGKTKTMHNIFVRKGDPATKTRAQKKPAAKQKATQPKVQPGPEPKVTSSKERAKKKPKTRPEPKAIKASDGKTAKTEPATKDKSLVEPKTAKASNGKTEKVEVVMKGKDVPEKGPKISDKDLNKVEGSESWYTNPVTSTTMQSPPPIDHVWRPALPTQVPMHTSSSAAKLTKTSTATLVTFSDAATSTVSSPVEPNIIPIPTPYVASTVWEAFPSTTTTPIYTNPTTSSIQTTAETPKPHDKLSDDKSSSAHSGGHHEFEPAVIPHEEIFHRSDERNVYDYSFMISFSTAVQKSGGSGFTWAMTKRMKHLEVADGPKKEDRGISMRTRLVEMALWAIADVLEEKLSYEALDELGTNVNHRRRIPARKPAVQSTNTRSQSEDLLPPAVSHEPNIPPRARNLVTLRHDAPEGGLASIASLVGEQGGSFRSDEKSTPSQSKPQATYAWVAFHIVYQIVDFRELHSETHSLSSGNEEKLLPPLLSAKEIEISVNDVIFDSIGDGSLLYHLRTYERRIVAVSEVGKERLAGVGLGGPFRSANESTVRKDLIARSYQEPLKPHFLHRIRIIGMAVLASTLCVWITMMRTSVARHHKRDLWAWRVGLRNEEEVHVLLRLSMGRGGNNDMAHWDDSSIQDNANTITTSFGGEDGHGQRGTMLIFGGPLGKPDSYQSANRSSLAKGQEWSTNGSLPSFATEQNHIPVNKGVYS